MQILALWNVFACWRAIRERSAWRVNPYTVLACSSAYPLYALCSEHTGPENPAVHFHRQSGLESLTVPSYLVRGTAHAPVYSVRRLRVHRIPNLTSRDYPPLDLSTAARRSRTANKLSIHSLLSALPIICRPPVWRKCRFWHSSSRWLCGIANLRSRVSFPLLLSASP
jgi:hypothetical protein